MANKKKEMANKTMEWTAPIDAMKKERDEHNMTSSTFKVGEEGDSTFSFSLLDIELSQN